MADETKLAPVKESTGVRKIDSGAYYAIGLSLGLVLGTIFGNPAVGLVIGLLLAALSTAYQEKRQGKKHANLALAISVGGLVIVLLILTLS